MVTFVETQELFQNFYTYFKICVDLWKKKRNRWKLFVDAYCTCRINYEPTVKKKKRSSKIRKKRKTRWKIGAGSARYRARVSNVSLKRLPRSTRCSSDTRLTLNRERSRGIVYSSGRKGRGQRKRDREREGRGWIWRPAKNRSSSSSAPVAPPWIAGIRAGAQPNHRSAPRAQYICRLYVRHLAARCSLTSLPTRCCPLYFSHSICTPPVLTERSPEAPAPVWASSSDTTALLRECVSQWARGVSRQPGLPRCDRDRYPKSRLMSPSKCAKRSCQKSPG